MQNVTKKVGINKFNIKLSINICENIFSLFLKYSKKLLKI